MAGSLIDERAQAIKRGLTSYLNFITWTYNEKKGVREKELHNLNEVKDKAVKIYSIPDIYHLSRELYSMRYQLAELLPGKRSLYYFNAVTLYNSVIHNCTSILFRNE